MEKNIEIAKSFEDMDLSENLLRGIYSYGFETPSAVQQKGILPLKSGGDVIIQAQSGSGKTGTFVIGLLSQLKERACSSNNEAIFPQALILSPTRELADQIANVFMGIGSKMDLRVRCCVGGQKVHEDERAIDDGVDILVGTPGRIIHLLSKKSIPLECMKTLVLDEADEMLNTDFQEDMRTIFSYLPSDVQVALFSATMPPEVLDLSKKFMNDPISILVKKEALTLDGITQFYVDCQREEYKYDVLKELYEYLNLSKAVIFCNSRNRVDRLSRELRNDGFTVSSIHGELSPTTRREVMAKFRSNESRILISTGLLSRGIDVQQVSVVINYDLPKDKETYIHQAGRSGRYGRKGLVINFITRRDMNVLRQLQEYYHTHIEIMPENVADYI